MANNKFWGSKNSVAKPTMGSVPASPNVPIMNKNSSVPSKKKNGLIKGFGIAGVIVAFVLFATSLAVYKFIVRPGMALTNTAKVLQDDVSAISKAAQDRDLVALAAALDKTDADLRAVRDEREKSFGWAKTQTVFKLNEFYDDSDHFINAGLYATDAIRELSVVITPFADAAGLKVSPDQVVEQNDGLMKAFQAWVSLMPEVAEKMDTVIAKVDKVGEELASVDTSKYPESFRGVVIRDNIEFAKNTLSKSTEYGPDIKQALMIFPRTLAVGTPTKRYMIVMQNNKEMRPTGGFMTNYATFKVSNGLLDSDFTSKDMYSIDLTLDIIDATYDFPDPPYPYGQLLKVERWYARDMNYSPDFPTSMDQLMKFYSMAGRLNPVEIKPVDGIIAIDTDVIKELLTVTGPVSVNGTTYTSDNVVLELEKIASLELREQSNRKRVLGDLMEAMLKNLFESEKALWSQLIEKGVDLAMRKHIQAYLFDPEAQALLEKYSFAGRINDKPDTDYLMVVSTNLGGDKTNWFTNKEVTSSVEKSGDRYMRTVKVKYTYTQPEPDYQVFAKRFRDWVRVYAPLNSELIGVEGSAMETKTDQERGRTWFSGYVELGPGESTEITFKYYLPNDVVKDNKYNLFIQKQGGVNAEPYHVIVAGKTMDYTVDKDTTVSVKF